LRRLFSKTVLFNSLFIVELGPHWLWMGSVHKKGYGQIYFGGKTERIHRVSAYLFLDFDLNNEKYQVNHIVGCHQKNCWNPEHLYVGTAADNTNDIRKEGGFEPKAHCKYGHELTEDNIYYGSKGERNCKTCTKERSLKRYYNGI
jgi:hypothetical protein